MPRKPLSSAAFAIADLKRRDPRWSVRDVDDLVGEAAPHGLELLELVEMPVNNLSLVFQGGAGRLSSHFHSHLLEPRGRGKRVLHHG